MDPYVLPPLDIERPLVILTYHLVGHTAPSMLAK